MSHLCGHNEGTTVCEQPARWMGSFKVGAWLTLVPLCEEHARTFHLMIEAATQAGRLVGGAVSIPVTLGIVSEIYSMEEPPQPYGRPRQLWRCSECDLPIVRSLERPGEWVLAAKPAMADRIDQGLRPHVHLPG